MRAWEAARNLHAYKQYDQAAVAIGLLPIIQSTIIGHQAISVCRGLLEAVPDLHQHQHHVRPGGGRSGVVCGAAGRRQRHCGGQDLPERRAHPRPARGAPQSMLWVFSVRLETPDVWGSLNHAPFCGSETDRPCCLAEGVFEAGSSQQAGCALAVHMRAWLETPHMWQCAPCFLTL